MRKFQLLILSLVASVVAVATVPVPSFADDDATQVGSHDHESKMQESEKKIEKSLEGLSAGDKKLAVAQRFCPIMTYGRLGAMGAPVKVMLEGKPVFVCCKGCVTKAQKDASKTLKTVEKLKDSAKVLAELPAEERVAIEAQKYCAVANTSLLGSMGAPLKMEIDGNPVYLCCKGCVQKAKSDPAGVLAKAEELKKAGKPGGK